MDRRNFLKSALATAGSVQSAIVLGGMRPLEQFAGPKDAIVVPGGMALRWHEPITLTLLNDAPHSHFVFENCFMTQFNVENQKPPVLIPAFSPSFHYVGLYDVIIDVQFYGQRALATPPAS